MFADWEARRAIVLAAETQKRAVQVFSNAIERHHKVDEEILRVIENVTSTYAGIFDKLARRIAEQEERIRTLEGNPS